METNRRNFLKNMGLNSMFVCSGTALASVSDIHGESSVISPISDETYSQNGVFNVFSFGAKGDGKTPDTEAIQAAIDRCNQEGGGKVYLHKGCFLISSINLKSNVTLHIEAGAILKSGDVPVNKRMIISENEHNITICGRGIIDANGDYVFSKSGPYVGNPTSEVRPGIISFRSCENILVRDITFYNAASWIQTYTLCKNVVIDGITVDSRENKDIEKTRYADSPGRNTDGCNLVDSEKVRISNCFIYCGDDGIVLKSHSPDKACRDITITNCVISTNASGIKIGTETAGAFEDITIQNCVVFDTRNEGIALLTADGARVERINVSNITLRNIKGAAIALRLGVRNRLYVENAKLNVPLLKDIIIENIQGTRISADYGCNITGLRNFPVENVIIKSINLQFDGGGKIEDSYREIPEQEKSYPSGRVFGRIPAYGFFIRHVKNIILENVWLRFTHEDYRPAIVCDDVEQIEIKGMKASGTLNTPELIRMTNTRNVVISESRPTSPVPVFLLVQGDKSERIVLQSNLLYNAAKHYIQGKNTMKKIITEFGTSK